MDVAKEYMPYVIPFIFHFVQNRHAVRRRDDDFLFIHANPVVRVLLLQFGVMIANHFESFLYCTSSGVGCPVTFSHFIARNSC